MWNKIQISLYFLLVLSVSLISCTKDINIPDLATTSDGFVHFTVNVPAATIPRKSSQIPAEVQINEVQVLVFEDGLYSYMRPGLNLDQSTGNVTFLARLNSSNVPTTIYLIANNNDFVKANEPIENASIEEVKTLLDLAYTSDGVNGNVALWGSYLFETGISASVQFAAEPISLLRAVARVDVEVTPTAAAQFRLNSIRVFRASDKIQIIPNGFNNGTSVSEPSIPSNTNVVNTNPINTTSAIMSQAQVYLPESAAPNQISDATCIVVGGFYDDRTTESFYRLDFNPNGDGYQLGQVLRNHRYVFSINEVGNSGFTSPEEAANSSPVGMIATLLVWNDSDHLNIYFDDNDFFALNTKYVDLSGFNNSSTRIKVVTSATSYQMRFLNPETTWSTIQLDDGIFRVQQLIENGQRFMEITARTENPMGGTVRERLMEVRVNDVNRIYLSLNQLPRMQIQWSMHNVSSFGDTTTVLNARGLLYQWDTQVGWNDMGTGVPPGWPAAIVSRSPVWQRDRLPCPPGWRLPFSIEFRELLAEYPGRREEISTSPLLGMWFGRTQAEANEATFANPGNCIFFPYACHRTSTGTTWGDNKINGFYWAADPIINVSTNQVTQVVYLSMGRQFAIRVDQQNINRNAISIRCVRDLPH